MADPAGSGADSDGGVAPFAIFSMARCGSTTLMRALNCYPGIRCMLEPFTPANLSSSYSGVSSAAGLREALTEIFRRYNGIKHVWHPDGWPFREAPELNRRLLASEGLRIIFLNRRNSLQRVVSVEMSKQTGVWGRFTAEELQRARAFHYEPLRVEKLRHEMRVGAAGLVSLSKVLEEARAEVLELWYEDLFGAAVGLAERVAGLDRAGAFLRGPAAGAGADPGQLRDLLDPSSTRLNTTETYRLIPNANDIELLLGSDANGWLFDERGAGAHAGGRSLWDTKNETVT
jgi:hypothetical protein